MPVSTAAKIAMCACPPAMMVGAVATVPAVKRAVHHATAHHGPRSTHPAASAQPARTRQINCTPAGGALPPAPIVTYASPIAPEPGGGDDSIGPITGRPITGAAAPAAAGIPIVAALAAAPASSPAASPDIGAVPEPATWLMLIAGLGIAGAALRRRRQPIAESAKPAESAKLTGRALLWSGGALAEAGEAAATMAIQSTTVAGKSALAGVGKVMMCVCPAAVVAGSVVAVPPLRQAVYAATMPAVPAAAPLPAPCPQATIPVSATAVKGFPATVATIPTRS